MIKAARIWEGHPPSHTRFAGPTTARAGCGAISPGSIPKTLPGASLRPIFQQHPNILPGEGGGHACAKGWLERDLISGAVIGLVTANAEALQIVFARRAGGCEGA